MNQPILFLLVIAILIISFFYLVLKMIFTTRLKVAKRIEEIQAPQPEEKGEEDPYSLPIQERLLKPLFHKAEKSIMKWTPYALKLREQQMLTAAGHPHHLTLQEWMTWRMVFWIGFGSLFTFFASFLETRILKVVIPLVGWIVGYLAPIFYLKRKKDERIQAIEKGLPDVLDILTVSVEAGLGFDAAIVKVVEKTSGILSDEFHKMLQEMKMGKSRREALRNLGSRTSTDDMNQFVGAIIQADQLGIRIGNVLRIQSEDMRQKRRQRAEEKAMKAPIKILFPLVFFIFPAIFIIVLGPAVIQIIHTFMK
ncbi:type II secretion system F family protein [Tepidibacillus fermentans]|uniref:Tight adherence protein C n=1 Tax=Tepidibacillus fermentans TaxID=1281767 RepID=A0A4R3KJI3_9BACI|nr:type II secretion system F family protein [Tepidibacillus fermentans]TCS83331.1 tight adherence protein C [Tepidibacillus fermentans]